MNGFVSVLHCVCCGGKKIFLVCRHYWDHRNKELLKFYVFNIFLYSHVVSLFEKKINHWVPRLDRIWSSRNGLHLSHNDPHLIYDIHLNRIASDILRFYFKCVASVFSFSHLDAVLVLHRLKNNVITENIWTTWWTNNWEHCLCRLVFSQSSNYHTKYETEPIKGSPQFTEK